MQRQLEHARRVRGQLGSQLVDLRLEIATALDELICACHREHWALSETGDLADGNLVPLWEILEDKIHRLRVAMGSVRDMNDIISSAVRDLADDELWKESA